MLRIEAMGSSIQEKNEKRGRLFEKLCREILTKLGYEIRSCPRVNYAGMEIDIEGEKKIEKTSFIGECKAYTSDISSEKLQQFVGKLHPKWSKDKTIQGIFMVLPKLNSHARAYYNESYKDSKEFILRVLEEDDILKCIFDSALCISPNELKQSVLENYSLRLGDRELIYTENGFFWFQYLIDPEEGIPNCLCVLNSKGEIVEESYFINCLQNLSEDFSGLTFLSPKQEKMVDKKVEVEEIVEIRGSKEWFEYQFPASPPYFVGRDDLLKEVGDFINDVVGSKTSSRVIVINGNSGWGKSSFILKIADEIKSNALVLPIDSRSASSSRFLLYAMKYMFDKIRKKKFVEMKQTISIGGYDSLSIHLERLDRLLRKDRKVVIVFFDQFESIFYKPNILEKLRNFALMLTDKQYNIIVGFSWKIDLVGITHDFPYKLRDDISNISKVIRIKKFGEIEMQCVINALSKEIKAQVRKDLAFRLSEFSQGLPWLLKKLCAHIIRQCQKGMSQLELFNKLLNIQELFDEDIDDLSPQEQEVLKYIAKEAPISITEISEAYSKEIISSLINRRLIVQVGSKYDVYWDIFKDYLNTGKLPAEETYILRTTHPSLLTLLREFINKDKISIERLIKKVPYTEKTTYNILKDAKILNLIEIRGDIVKPLFNFRISEQELLGEVKNIIKEKLGKHKIVAEINHLFIERDEINVKQIAAIFARTFPYIKADQKTWDTYARNLGRWMDFADYGIYMKDVLRKFDPTSDVKSRYTLGARYKGRSFFMPQIQYIPIEETMEKVGDAIRNKSPLNIDNSRMRKALRDAVEIGFIETSQNKIRLTSQGILFINNKERRRELFREGILKIEIFKEFLKLWEDSGKNRTINHLSEVLNNKYGNRWKRETAKGIIKVLINWAKHAGFITKKIMAQEDIKQMKIF